jgi:hypothetical protein
MQGDPYKVLGISRESTPEEIDAAYRAIADETVPNLSADECDGAIANYSTQMKAITAAYLTLSDPDRRFAFDRAGGGDASHSYGFAVAVREPSATECVLCASTPVRTATFRKNSGFFLVRRAGIYQLRTCRDCGLSIGRRVQNLTMLVGWWSITTFFFNLVNICQNAVEVLRSAMLGKPTPPRDDVARPLIRPLARGRSVLVRAGALVSVCTLILVGFCVVQVVNWRMATNSRPQAGLSIPLPWRHYVVGQCVETDGLQQITAVVTCDQPHFAEINGIVSDASKCPWNATYKYVETSGDPSPGDFVCLNSHE